MSQDELVRFLTDHATVIVGTLFALYAGFQGLRILRRLRSSDTSPEAVRTRALIPLASRMGLMFVGEFSPPPWTPSEAPLSPLAELEARAGVLSKDYAEAFGSFVLFGRGTLPHLWNLMAGSRNGVSVAVFDYRFYGEGSGNRSCYNQTVVSLTAASADLPVITVTTRACRPSIRSWLEGLVTDIHEVEFPTSPAFGREYVVSGQDEDAVRRLFGETLLSYLAGQPGLEVEGRGKRLLLYRRSPAESGGWSGFGKLEAPNEIENLLRLSLEIFRRLEPDAFAASS